MTLIRRKLSGGYEFKRFDGQPDAELVQVKLPSIVTINLYGLKPTVGVGDKVSAGDIIAEHGDGVSSPIIASISGSVESLEDDDALLRIKGDGKPEWKPLDGSTGNWKDLSADQIGDLLYRSGVSGLGKEGIPTNHVSSIIAHDEVDDLIISAVADDIYNISLDVLLRDEGLSRFCVGLSLLKRLMPNASVHVALSKNYGELSKSIEERLDDESGVSLYSVPSKYPQGTDEVLVPTILKKGFPYGYRASNIGVVVLDVQAVLHVYDAVVEGKPLIERTVALAGPGFSARPHVRIRIGAPFSECISAGQTVDGKSRAVINSVMTGAVIEDPSLQYVATDTSLVILLPEDSDRQFMSFVRPGFSDDAYALTFAASYLPLKKHVGTNLKGEERPCVSCGYCQDVCPVGIIPHLLYKYTSRGILDECLVNYRIFNCVDCNLCSYVCPSKIAVATHIRAGKESFIKDGVDNSVNVRPVFDLKGIDKEDAS